MLQVLKMNALCTFVKRFPLQNLYHRHIIQCVSSNKFLCLNHNYVVSRFYADKQKEDDEFYQSISGSLNSNSDDDNFYNRSFSKRNRSYRNKFDGVNNDFDENEEIVPYRNRNTYRGPRHNQRFYDEDQDFSSSFKRHDSRGRGFDEYNDFDDQFQNHDTGRFSSRREDRDRFGEDLFSDLKAKDWKSQLLSPVEKNFHVEHEAVAAMTQEQVDQFYTKHNIDISNDDGLKPILDFNLANFPEQIQELLAKKGWTEPSAIQSIAWPRALAGKDLVAVAQTGSGKTLAFILPTLVHIMNQRRVVKGEGPIAVVLAPTRELAQQTASVAHRWGRPFGIMTTAVFGGSSKVTQARQLNQGPELVVATPGRLLDFLTSDVLSLSRTSVAILDEADRMLDMGFEPQIRKIMGQIRPDRQTMMFSATWPHEIRKLASDFLLDFTKARVGSDSLRANPAISQAVLVLDDRRDKTPVMLKALEKVQETSEDNLKALVFVQTKISADFVAQRLKRAGYKCQSLHGDKTQNMRDKILHSFKKGWTEVVVATDVASRGLDVSDIQLVVNYDYPNTTHDYIHRIGRTGRASQRGRALTLLTEDDAGMAGDLCAVLRGAQQPVPPALEELAQLHRKLGKHGKNSKARRIARPQRNNRNSNWRNNF